MNHLPLYLETVIVRFDVGKTLFRLSWQETDDGCGGVFVRILTACNLLQRPEAIRLCSSFLVVASCSFSRT